MMVTTGMDKAASCPTGWTTGTGSDDNPVLAFAVLSSAYSAKLE